MDTIDQLLNLIRKERLDKGYSQFYVSAQIGVTQRCYGMIELRQIDLTIENFFEIMRVLDIEAKDLMKKLA